MLNNRHFDVDQSTQTNGRTYCQKAEQQLVHSGLTQSNPDFSISLTPTMHPSSEMDDFMQLNGALYRQEGDDQFLMMGAVHNPLDFDISILPDFMSPGGAIHNIAGYSSIETVPGLSKECSE